ncbi:hypothetical protein [Mycobacterium neumannii]|uniref:hypothetical protein n=1 Tax=Mycobacterium neumannii TaxID=2048551 RepID=UPI003AB5C67E
MPAPGAAVLGGMPEATLAAGATGAAGGGVGGGPSGTGGAGAAPGAGSGVTGAWLAVGPAAGGAVVWDGVVGGVSETGGRLDGCMADAAIGADCGGGIGAWTTALDAESAMADWKSAIGV